jgi:hypothetical protein
MFGSIDTITTRLTRTVVYPDWHHLVCNEFRLYEAFHSVVLFAPVAVQMVSHIGMGPRCRCSHLCNGVRPPQHIWLQTYSRNLGPYACSNSHLPGYIDEIYGALDPQHHHRCFCLSAPHSHHCETADAEETEDQCVWHLRYRWLVS